MRSESACATPNYRGYSVATLRRYFFRCSCFFLLKKKKEMFCCWRIGTFREEKPGEKALDWEIPTLPSAIDSDMPSMPQRLLTISSFTRRDFDDQGLRLPRNIRIFTQRRPLPFSQISLLGTMLHAIHLSIPPFSSLDYLRIVDYVRLSTTLFLKANAFSSCLISAGTVARVSAGDRRK